MANQVGLGTSPGVLAQFGANVAVAASQITTQSNPTNGGMSPAGPSQILAVSYGQAEPGKSIPQNGVLRS